MLSKAELRKFAKDFRKTLDIKKVSEEILQIFLQSDIYKKSKNIALYYPYNNELDTTLLFADDSKNFFLPKIFEDDSMLFCPYKNNDVLVLGKYDIKEPATSPVNLSCIDLMILPALMCDINGYRLGYGKGYYDKCLSSCDFSGIKIVLLPDKMLIHELPCDYNDIPVDVIFTEKRIQNCM